MDELEMLDSPEENTEVDPTQGPDEPPHTERTYDPSRVRRLNELRATESLQSTGFSVLKITRDGKAEYLEVPIKSSGVGELIERYQLNQPTPPKVKELVKQDSQAGREMGLSRDKWVLMPDYADEGFLKRQQRWQLDLTYSIVMEALNLRIYDDENKLVYDPEDRSKVNSEKTIATLKRLGFTQSHFGTIAEDAQNLTTMTEAEAEDFFSES